MEQGEGELVKAIIDKDKAKADFKENFPRTFACLSSWEGENLTIDWLKALADTRRWLKEKQNILEENLQKNICKSEKDKVRGWIESLDDDKNLIPHSKIIVNFIEQILNLLKNEKNLEAEANEVILKLNNFMSDNVEFIKALQNQFLKVYVEKLFVLIDYYDPHAIVLNHLFELLGQQLKVSSDEDKEKIKNFNLFLNLLCRRSEEEINAAADIEKGANRSRSFKEYSIFSDMIECGHEECVNAYLHDEEIVNELKNKFIVEYNFNKVMEIDWLRYENIVDKTKIKNIEDNKQKVLKEIELTNNSNHAIYDMFYYGHLNIINLFYYAKFPYHSSDLLQMTLLEESIIREKLKWFMQRDEKIIDLVEPMSSLKI